MHQPPPIPGYTIYDPTTQSFYFERVNYDIDTAVSKIFEQNLERGFGYRLLNGI